MSVTAKKLQSGIEDATSSLTRLFMNLKSAQVFVPSDVANPRGELRFTRKIVKANLAELRSELRKLERMAVEIDKDKMEAAKKVEAKRKAKAAVAKRKAQRVKATRAKACAAES